MTKYEKHIYDIINNFQNHLTAEQIFEKLKEKYPNVSRATVYNNLNSLCDNDLIKKISIENQPDRYDRIIKHDHLICKNCGKIIDINLNDLTVSLKKQLKGEFLSYDLKVFFVCDECKKVIK